MPEKSNDDDENEDDSLEVDNEENQENQRPILSLNPANIKIDL